MTHNEKIRRKTHNLTLDSDQMIQLITRFNAFHSAISKTIIGV